MICVDSSFHFSNMSFYDISTEIAICAYSINKIV